MKVETGLFDHMVLQRVKGNVSDAIFTGTCSATGTLKARVTRNGKALNGMAALAVGKAARGKFEGRLKGIQVGGPYNIELSIDGADGKPAEKLAVNDVLVGDVWMLGGQSNMQGCGRTAGLPKADTNVRAFYMNDAWAVAKDPIHNMWLAADQVHADLNGGANPPPPPKQWGAGPGVSFGDEMYRNTGVPQGLLACGHGGTSMAQWDPALKKLGSRSLYGATIRRFKKNGSRVAGIAWYQGCSDANKDAAAVYTQRMKKLVASFRRDFKNPRLPIVVVQIGRVIGWGESTPWNSIQDQQRLLSKVIPQCRVVPAIDLPLDDNIHLSGPGQWALGQRMAKAMLALTGGSREREITYAGADVVKDPMFGFANVVVKLDGVIGKLQAAGSPRGFEITDNTGTIYVYRVDLNGSRAILRTCLQPGEVNGRLLHYGLGTNPACTITDAAGRSIPVMGPIVIGGKPVAVTPYVTKPRISELLPSAGKLDSLACPDTTALKLRTRDFGQAFCSLHEELAARTPEDVLVYYACRIACAEPMKLVAGIGYDGPVKAWMDGKQIAHDPDGINPATIDKMKAPVAVAAGEHELVVALASNQGRAWGIFLRFQRTDVPLRLIKKGPGNYAMPEILG